MTSGRGTPGQLAAENAELKIRLGLLVRLLISKGIITAQEYAALIAEAQPLKDDRNSQAGTLLPLPSPGHG